MLVGRFRENKELLTEVKEGMDDNLRLAKANIAYLKQAKTQPAEQASEPQAAA